MQKQKYTMLSTDHRKRENAVLLIAYLPLQEEKKEDCQLAQIPKKVQNTDISYHLREIDVFSLFSTIYGTVGQALYSIPPMGFELHVTMEILHDVT